MCLFWKVKKYWLWRWLINKMTICQSRFVMSCIVDFILYNTCVSKYDYLKYAQMHISKYAHGRNRIPGWRALSTLGDMTKKQPMRFVLVYIDVEYNFLAWLIWDPFLAQGPLSLSDSGPLRLPVCLLLLGPPQCPAQNPQKASATFVCPVVYLESPKVSRSDHGRTVLHVGRTPKLS